MLILIIPIVVSTLLQTSTSEPAYNSDNAQSSNNHTLLQVTQYYFIPNSSYLQFRVSAAELGKSSAYSSISQSKYCIIYVVNGILGFNITNRDSTGILFNIVVFPPDAQEDVNYQFYSCYMRAAF